MDDEQGEALRRLVIGMEQLSRVTREIGYGVAREADCTKATLGIVRLLDVAGEVGVGDLARLLHVDMSVASRQVSLMVTEGLVERTVTDQDRRARSLRLTPRGRSLAVEVQAVMRQRVRDVFADWSTDQLQQAAQVMEHLVSSAGRTARLAAAAAESQQAPPAGPAPGVERDPGPVMADSKA